MAIKIYEKFAPRANPADGDYPYGSIKNESVPGAKDGTPLDAVWANDYAGTDAELFAQAGIVPNGQPDKLGASQRVDAISQIAVVKNFNSYHRSYAGAGLDLVGTFNLGVTLTDSSQLALYSVDGKAYRWSGAYPKVVPSGSSPSDTGGIGAGAWEDVSGTLPSAQYVGYSGIISVDDRLRINGVSPSDREWNCTPSTADCSTQIEEAWLKAQELKTNLILPYKYKVSRKLDMNCPNYFVGSEIVGNGKWSSGIEYTGASNIDSILDFRTAPGSTITTLGIKDLGVWGNRKADHLLSSLNGFAFTDLKIDNNLFNGGRVSNVSIAAFVARINNNYFRDGDGTGISILEKPIGWVGPYQNTTLTMFANFALYVARGYDISNVGYSEFYANAADGESIELAYKFDNVNGAFRNNGAERIKRYGEFNSCVFSEFSGYASAAGIGATGVVIPSLVKFTGGSDVNLSGFSDPDISTVDATYTDKFRVELGNANLDVRVKTAAVNPSHFRIYGTPASAAKNPRGVYFERDSRYSSKDAGGMFFGGVISNEYSAVKNSLSTSKNPVSKSSLSFYLGASGQVVRLSNYPSASITKTNAAMYSVRVKGVGKFSGETWEYLCHCVYVNNGSLTVSVTPIKPRTGGQPFTISDSTGYIALTNNGAGTDTLFIVDVDAVAAGGDASASMSYGTISPFF